MTYNRGAALVPRNLYRFLEMVATGKLDPEMAICARVHSGRRSATKCLSTLLKIDDRAERFNQSDPVFVDI